MSPDISIGTRPFPRVGLAGLLALIASTAMAQSIQGTATYRDRMALPQGAVFEATLEDVSRGGAPVGTIARTRIASPGNPPIAFTIAYDPAKIRADHRYAVRARILFNEELLFTTDVATVVITGGRPTRVSVVLRRAAAGRSGLPNPAGTRPLEGTYWKAIELVGKPLPPQDPGHEAYLQFQAGGRVYGSDGCSGIIGSYQLEADLVTFGQMVGTQTACLNTGEIERTFRDVLTSATRLTVLGDRLELFDPTGKRVAAFAAGAHASVAWPPDGLAGTSWQLVKFRGSNGTTLTPDDGAKYTIAFSAGGRLTARVDCNWGHGTWRSSGSNQLEFGPLALTRAKCPAGSLDDHVMKQWGSIRSYVIKDGHLFLALQADGGMYEFEPVTKTRS